MSENGNGNTPNPDFIDFNSNMEQELGDRPYVQIQTSTGGSQVVLLEDIDGDPTISAVMGVSGLFTRGAVTYLVDGQEVEESSLMAAGQILTVIGNVKGG